MLGRQGRPRIRGRRGGVRQRPRGSRVDGPLAAGSSFASASAAAAAAASGDTPLRRSARLRARRASVEPDTAPLEREGEQRGEGESQANGLDLASRAREAEMARVEHRRRAHELVERSEIAGAPSSPLSGGRRYARSPASADALVRSEALTSDRAPPIEMRIIGHPAPEAGRNEVLHPPLTVRLRQGAGHEGMDMSQIWATVSLMDESGTTALAPPRQDLLRGRVVDSPRSYMGPASFVEDEGVVSGSIAPEDTTESESYVTFSDLAILEPGRYRIRVTLLRMQGEASPGATASSPGGSSIQHILSRVIEVRDLPRTVGASECHPDAKTEAHTRTRTAMA